MRIETAIERKKQKLIDKALKNGLYENFGQKEVRELEYKYIDISNYSKPMNEKRKKLESFNEWCINFDVQDLKKYKVENNDDSFAPR
jgi:hypothetical protein